MLFWNRQLLGGDKGQDWVRDWVWGRDGVRHRGRHGESLGRY